MDDPRIGQRVITDIGDGIVTTITAGHSNTDIHLYRVDSGTTHRWYYLDEIIPVPILKVER